MSERRGVGLCGDGTAGPGLNGRAAGAMPGIRGAGRPMGRGLSAHISDNESLLAGALRVGDVLVILLTGYIAWLLRSGGAFGLETLNSFYLAGFLLAGLLVANGMHLIGAYDRAVLRDPLRLVARGAAAWLIVALALVLLSVLTKTSVQYSRLWFGLWIALGLGGLLLLRALACAQMARWKRQGLAGRRLAILGQGAMARDLAQEIARAPGTSVTVVGLISTGQEAGAPPPAAGLPTLGPLDRLPELVAAHRLQEVVLAVPWQDETTLKRALAAARGLALDLRLAPERLLGDIPVHGVSTVLGLPMLDLWRRPLSTWDLVVKAIEDRVLASLFLLLAAVPMALIAVAIRLDSPGPVLFRQRRAGFGSETFELLKFRSMYVDCDPDGRVPQARRNDPRVTRVGRILRRTSLDELPQLFNVLRGEMSLVGPRPHAVEHDSHYAAALSQYLSRHRVKPGLTGWAQIHGLRGETDTAEKMRQRVALDLYYIDNWSFWLDLKILCLTPFTLLLQDNAY